MYFVSFKYLTASAQRTMKLSVETYVFILRQGTSLGFDGLTDHTGQIIFQLREPCLAELGEERIMRLENDAGMAFSCWRHATGRCQPWCSSNPSGQKATGVSSRRAARSQGGEVHGSVAMGGWSAWGLLHLVIWYLSDCPM